MDYEVYKNGRQVLLNEEQAAQIEKILDDADKTLLTTKSISDLNGFSFLVRNYQRGYRWTKTEIEELLQDIKNINDEEIGYCMQPLIVKKIPAECKAERKLSLNGLEDTQGNLEGAVYELLDGQQRLSTLWLLLSVLNDINREEIDLHYSIFYELKRSTDSYFLKNAVNTIKIWFKNDPKYNSNAKYKYKKLVVDDPFIPTDAFNAFRTRIQKLFFIWYEVDPDTPSEKVFQSINEGKIELTNAELFKALLLNPDNLSELDGMHFAGKLQQIAFEWDRIESGLRDDDFWFFLSKEDVEKSSQKTRIDYIVEIYARALNQKEKYGFDENKDRFSFLVIQRYLQNNNSQTDFYVIESVWESIVRVYDKLFAWYQDQELYHTIGFLVAAEEKNRGSNAVVSPVVAEIYAECKEMKHKDVKQTVRRRIASWMFDGIDNNEEQYSETIKYGEIKTAKLRNILLFTNIFSVTAFQKDSDSEDSHSEDSTTEEQLRFPFRIYHDTKSAWDIEHIAPQTLESDLTKCKDYKTFFSSIQVLKKNLEKEAKRDNEDKEKKKKALAEIKQCADYLAQMNKNNYKSVEGYKACCDFWKTYAEEVTRTPDDRICNLVLLNASINRSYGNAFFSEKRKAIIANDSKGIFIPVCTKNVFLKYYSTHVGDPEQWEEEDKNDYGKQINDILNKVKRWKE